MIRWLLEQLRVALYYALFLEHHLDEGQQPTTRRVNPTQKERLDGEYGQLTQWTAEFFEAGDEEFIESFKKLDQIDLDGEDHIEIESKEQLREEVVDRTP